MAELYTKTECKLHGTPYCAALNMKNCADCFASKLDSEQQEALIEDIGYIAAALPEDGIESFLDEPECMLCKGSEKGKPEFFAQLSMGHDHPTVDYLDEKSNKKYKRSTAMLIPVQLPACRKCRSLLMQSYFVPIIVGVVFAAAGLVLTCSRSSCAVRRSDPLPVFPDVCFYRYHRRKFASDHLHQAC